MNRTLIAAAVVWVVSLPAHLNAAVFQRDWKTPGDGLLTYDDVNQREWLDLSVSLLNQFAEPRLSNAVSQVAPGGLFEGFSWANAHDVRLLAESAGIDPTIGNYAINHSATRNLIDLLGVTYAAPPFTRSLGFIDPSGISVPTPSRAGADFYVSFNELTGQGGVAGVLISSGDDFFNPTYNPNLVGVMLFRSVPEPASLSMVLSCWTLIIVIRLRK